MLLDSRRDSSTAFGVATYEVGPLAGAPGNPVGRRVAFLSDPPSAVSVCSWASLRPAAYRALSSVSPGLTSLFFLFFFWLNLRWNRRQDADFREDPYGEDYHS